MTEQQFSCSLQNHPCSLPGILNHSQEPETHQSIALLCPGPGAEPEERAEWKSLWAQTEERAWEKGADSRHAYKAGVDKPNSLGQQVMGLGGILDISLIKSLSISGPQFSHLEYGHYNSITLESSSENNMRNPCHVFSTMPGHNTC